MFTLVALVLVLFADTSSAWAHTELMASDPTDGAVIEVAPQSVTLQFTEKVSVQPDGVRVLNSRGRRVDKGSTTVRDTTSRTPLNDRLPNGSYLVSWRAISADGHPVRGAFSFSVGEASELSGELGDVAFSNQADRPLEISGALLRFVAYGATMGACGYVLVSAWLRRSEEPTPVSRMVVWAIVVAVGSSLLQIVVLAALATGNGLTSILDPGVLGLVLGDGIAAAFGLALVALVALAITKGLPFEGPARVLALAGSLLAPSAFVITGHTRTMEPAVAGYLLDTVHVLGATVWFGGLAACVATVDRRHRANDTMGSAEAVASFSGLAAVASSLVLGAGLGLGVVEVGSLPELTGTTYGRVLIAKVLLIAIVIAIAGWNRFKLVPAVARDALNEAPGSVVAGQSRPWLKLMMLMRAEIALLVVVLGVTGALVNITPAETSRTTGPASVSAELGEGTVSVTVDPARPGRNDVHIYIYDAQGRASADYDSAEISLELPDQDLGPFNRDPVRVSPGHFQLIGTDLPLGGKWTITITVKPDRFSETSASVTIPVGK